MKITKILPVLAAAALLTGCNISKSHSVKPDKYKKEAAYADVLDGVNQALADSGVSSFDNPVDCSYKGVGKFSITMEMKMNGKTRDKETLDQFSEYAAEFDKDSSVAHTKVSGEIGLTMSQCYGAGKVDVKQEAQTEFYAQEVQNGTNYNITFANKNEGLYSVSTSTSASLFNDFVGRVMAESGFGMGEFISKSTYEAKTDEEKALYKFYLDGDVYTQVFNNELSDKDENREMSQVNKEIVQYKVSGTKLSFFIETAVKSSVKYLKDTTDYVAGQEMIQDYTTACKGTFDFAAVELTMIDVSNMATAPTTYDANSMFSLNLGL